METVLGSTLNEMAKAIKKFNDAQAALKKMAKTLEPIMRFQEACQKLPAFFNPKVPSLAYLLFPEDGSAEVKV